MHLSLDRLQRLALLSVLLNGALVGLKYFLARMSGSTALLADAVHSATDVLASLMLFHSQMRWRNASHSSKMDLKSASCCLNSS